MEEENQSILENKTDGKEKNENEKHWFPFFDFSRKAYRTYDGTFLILLMVVNFNMGLILMMTLAGQDYFKDYLK